MSKLFQQIDRKFKKHWKNYVLQSFFATIAIFLATITLHINGNTVVIASIGATTFIIFALPSKITAQPRNVIGGYLVGIVCGSLFHLLPFHASILYSIAVGISIFIMVVTNTEHPPASGVALDFAIRGFSVNLAIGVVLSIIILALVHRLFRPYLKDLA